MVKVISRQAPPDSPIFNGRFVISSHNSHSGPKNRDLISLIREVGDQAMADVAKELGLSKKPSPSLANKLRTTAAQSLVARGLASNLDEALKMVDEEI